jgi:hypothetical protein
LVVTAGVDRVNEYITLLQPDPALSEEAIAAAKESVRRAAALLALSVMPCTSSTVPRMCYRLPSVPFAHAHSILPRPPLHCALSSVGPPPHPRCAIVGEQAVLSLTPTLISDLMFHDLVFGHDLGSGSFSHVKYAKRIIKGQPASTWPEYAVKIIATDVIQRLGTCRVCVAYVEAMSSVT